MQQSIPVSDQCLPISLTATPRKKIARYAKSNTKSGLVKKNKRKGINNRIANHKLVFHGVPIPPASQPPQPPKKQKIQPPETVAGYSRWTVSMLKLTGTLRVQLQNQLG